MSASCHGSGAEDLALGRIRIALVGSPNAGKTSVFNHLTGRRGRTGNYPGVTVTRSVGTARCRRDDGTVVDVEIEDLPGTYSLTPISRDEQIVADLFAGQLSGVPPPDAVVVVVEVTVLARSLSLVGQVLALGLPTAVVLTMTDELAARGGRLDIEGFATALGVPVVGVVGTRATGFDALRTLVADPAAWPRVPVPPPTDDREFAAWVSSLLAAGGHHSPDPDARTTRIDRVLLHPLWGSLIFLAVMFLFFQVVFTVAVPLQELIEAFFEWAGDRVGEHVPSPVLSGLVGSAVIGGVGSVLVFIPQIVLMFLLIALLENVGYMSRAAFLVDRVMATTGLEGRAFVAMFSSLACAIPGIMATRTIPSSRDRIATIMAAPLMTCSARLPVYVLLVGLLVDPSRRWGPMSVQGVVMFGLYLLGGVGAMTTAWLFTAAFRRRTLVPFYMAMPPYRFPTPKSVLLTMGDATRAFLRKAGTIILAASVVLWCLLNLPTRSDEIAGLDESLAAAYVLDNSYAAAIGKALEPVFAPLGFDWHTNVGLLGALAAREVFVSTLGQIYAADNPDDPQQALREATRRSDPTPGNGPAGGFAEREMVAFSLGQTLAADDPGQALPDAAGRSDSGRGEPVYTPPTVVALLVFFAFALLCMSTVATIRRETNSWRWPLIAFGYMFALAWVAAFAARHLVLATGWVT